jgi:hypothetical protein
MFGDTLTVNGTSVNFPGNRYKVLALYHELVSPAVRMEDLIATEDMGEFAVKDGYNMFNKWNTELGIVHLCSPPNALQAEIQLGADATILRCDENGNPIVLPEPLICCSQYGSPNRNSDPTIGSSVNALARAGRMITLSDPIGLYMDSIDTTGWSCPDGSNPADYVTYVRGSQGRNSRIEVEVPGRRFSVGDITIGGTRIEYGGQIAECISVNLVAKATVKGVVNNACVPCDGNCRVDPTHPVLLKSVAHGKPSPAGTTVAFTMQGGSLSHVTPSQPGP